MGVNKRKQVTKRELVPHQRAEGINRPSGGRCRQFVGRSTDTEEGIEAPSAGGYEALRIREPPQVFEGARLGSLD